MCNQFPWLRSHGSPGRNTGKDILAKGWDIQTRLSCLHLFTIPESYEGSGREGLGARGKRPEGRRYSDTEGIQGVVRGGVMREQEGMGKKGGSEREEEMEGTGKRSEVGGGGKG